MTVTKERESTGIYIYFLSKTVNGSIIENRSNARATNISEHLRSCSLTIEKESRRTKFPIDARD